ncbi:MAG TPA: glycosyltransferase [Clostridiales bacterium]|jgi:glycosyltransferase involved in cell wall biosynthesis|nr:glycosyltransferase [Clostridiales bacterium]HBR07660.1 glycosyltransferase [Clostridiales bacterium]
METVYFIVPCYNEEAVLPETFLRLGEKLRGLMADGLAGPGSRILCVDDGSQDRTWALIKSAHADSPIFTGISLDRNRGHQTALTEGLLAAREMRAVSISIDADLQDDVDAVDAMLKKHRDGAHIVCGVRKSRETDTFAKRVTARAYYRLMRLFGSSLIYDHADFRLMDAQALDRLALYHGDDLFLRGLITRLGFTPEIVYYDRMERFAGESKYTLKKMLKLAAKGVTSGKMKPEPEPRASYTHTREALPF